ncbi:MAG: YcnI family protein [Jiangellaceae bacterium]
MTTHSRARTRAALAALGTVGLLIAVPTIAAAHVTVRPDVDTSGSFSKLTFRVPNESDTAGTVALRVELPADTPFPSVSVQPHVGWTAELTREPLPEPIDVGEFTLEEAVTAVTWTANDGVRIGPGEFDEFAISVGPLPEPGEYALPAEQTYDDGEVVAWADAPDAEHPAPALIVAPVGGGGGDGDDDRQAAREDGDRERPTAEERAAIRAERRGEDASGGDSGGGDSSDGVARGLAVAGLAVGAVGLGVGAWSLRRSRA